MAQGYCGKLCEECGQRNCCPGCQEGPGNRQRGDCPLSQCVHRKGLESCTDCRFTNNCGHFSDRDRMPELRERKAREQQVLQNQMLHRAELLSVWLTRLFWLMIVSLPLGFLGNVFEPLMPVISVTLSLLQGLILLRMGALIDGYRTAGRLFLCAVAVNLIVELSVSSVLVSKLITVGRGILEIVGSYYVYRGHSEAMWTIDSQLSYRWERLWKWKVWIAVVVVCMPVDLILLAGSAFLLALCSLLFLGLAVASVVLSVLELIYLYKSAKAAEASVIARSSCPR